jgi:predicted nucleic-acid-binding Zn-ribbon protein
VIIIVKCKSDRSLKKDILCTGTEFTKFLNCRDILMQHIDRKQGGEDSPKA